MRTSRYYVTAAVLDGKIYAVGGYNDSRGSGALRSCERYDPAADAWEPVPDMAAGRSGKPAAAVLDGKLWVAGGYDGRCTLASVEVFDPASNTWDATKAAMTTGRYDHALAVLGGELHAVGGQWGQTSVEKYDPRADSWSVVPGMALPEGRTGRTAAVLMR